MKIAIFGASGMLGHILTKLSILEGKFEVVPFSRQVLPGDLSKVNYRQFDAATYNPQSEEFDYVINCCGLIKQRNCDKKDYFLVNSDFPRKLADVYGKRLIHVSTDCVFSGQKGLYVENDEKDCIDDYGKSKSEGEDPRCRTLRTSIIGTHPFDNSGLLEWFRSSSGKTVKGYQDHFWGGVTTLRLSQRILQQLGSESLALQHVYSDRISKMSLLENIRDIFDIDIKIDCHKAGFLDRSLISSIAENYSNGHISKQLEELREFERIKL